MLSGPGPRSRSRPLQALLATILILFVGYLAGGTRIFGPDTALVSFLAPSSSVVKERERESERD